MPLLAEHFTVIAPDLPGHAFSEVPRWFEPSLPVMAAALEELIDALHVTPQVAVGHSAGAALLARMTVVPFIPIRPAALLGIVQKKLGQVVGRAREAHDLELVIEPAVPEAIAARCREVESGARNIDHILRGTILPLVSTAILRNIADGSANVRMRLGVDAASGEFTCSSEGAAGA